jgi:hypothetical protein
MCVIVAVLAVWQPDGTSDQKWLNEQAREPLEHNADMLKPRLPYRELAAKLEKFQSNFRKDGVFVSVAGWAPKTNGRTSLARPLGILPLEGMTEPNMFTCLESYVGWDCYCEDV